MRVLLLVIVLALGGCRTLPPAVPAVGDGVAPDAAFAARQAQLATLDAWTLRGRTAISAHGQGWNGTVHWDQRADGLDLRFIAPLGAGTVRITGSPGAMRVQGSDGTDFMSDDVDADLEHWLGAPVPVAALRWWVLGVPTPGDPVTALELDVAGRALGIEQGGWAIEYPRYAAHDGTVVPAVVVATRDGTRVRMVIDRWNAP